MQTNDQVDAALEVELNGTEETPQKSGKSLLFKAITWLLTLGCFYLVISRLDATAAREDLTVLEYLHQP